MVFAVAFFFCKWERRRAQGESVRIGQEENDDGDAGKQKRRAADGEGRKETSAEKDDVQVGQRVRGR